MFSALMSAWLDHMWPKKWNRTNSFQLNFNRNPRNLNKFDESIDARVDFWFVWLGHFSMIIYLEWMSSYFFSPSTWLNLKRLESHPKFLVTKQPNQPVFMLLCPFYQQGKEECLFLRPPPGCTSLTDTALGLWTTNKASGELSEIYLMRIWLTVKRFWDSQVDVSQIQSTGLIAMVGVINSP